MSPATYGVWLALRDLGAGTTPPEIAVHIGRSESTAREHLRALEAAGLVVRVGGRRVFGQRLPDGWRAVGDAPAPTPVTAVEAVRQVLERGPVIGQREVARRSGYGSAQVAVALARVAVAEPVGRGWQCRYRLREGA